MTDFSSAKPPPEGWVLQMFPETFSAHAGPFYFRQKGDPPGVGFYAESYHANIGGIVHGGVLMTLADMSLWDICRREVGRLSAVTVSLQADFLSPGRIGDYIEATGEMTQGGKSLLFARGFITGGGKRLLSFSGTLKRFSQDALHD
jgi:acyl-coenzyme A thioesterase 13